MAFPNVTGYPGPYDVFVPNFSGKTQSNLIISYARDPKKFLVNGLATRTPKDLLTGLFLQLRPEALARVFNNKDNYIWVDGQPFPTGNHNPQDFRSIPYQCERVAMPDYMGQQTEEQAVWPLESTKIDALGHMMMTLRSIQFYSNAYNVTNLDQPGGMLSSHVKTATQWSSLNGATGGGWQLGTPENPIIKRTMFNVANACRKDSLATVSYKDLCMVIDPDAAIIMNATSELHWYLGQSPFAKAQVRGDEPSLNGEWGLPDKLYGMDVKIDPTLQTISGRLIVPGTYQDVANYNTALFMAMPGALKENIGQVNSMFSSFHMFVYKGQEMVVKTQFDQWNQYTKLGIYETYDFVTVAPETCALATSLFV